VIRQFGRVLTRAKRSYDTVARLGGDEFVWLLLGVGRDDALRVAERAQRLISGSVFNGTHEPIRVTATFGVASLSPGGNGTRRPSWRTPTGPCTGEGEREEHGPVLPAGEGGRRCVGDPRLPRSVLARKAVPVASVTDRIRALIRDMFETMYAAEGIGLAATQVGVGKRVVVLDVSPVDETIAPLAVVNPEIVSRSGSVTGVEGCLSVPGSRARCAAPKPSRYTAWTRRGIRFGSGPPGSSPALCSTRSTISTGSSSSSALPPPRRPPRGDPPAARSRAGRLRTVFMGTPRFAVPSLAALAEAADVTLVLCNPDRPAGVDDRWRLPGQGGGGASRDPGIPAGEGSPPRRRRPDRFRGARPDRRRGIRPHPAEIDPRHPPYRVHQRPRVPASEVPRRGADQLGGGAGRNGDGHHDHADGRGNGHGAHAARAGDADR